MTACSFAVSAHVCWNWAARAAPTAIPRFIPDRTLSTSRSLDMRRPGSIRRHCLAAYLPTPLTHFTSGPILRPLPTTEDLLRGAHHAPETFPKQINTRVGRLQHCVGDSAQRFSS